MREVYYIRRQAAGVGRQEPVNIQAHHGFSDAWRLAPVA